MEDGASGVIGVHVVCRVGLERESGLGDAIVHHRDQEEGVLGCL